MGKIENKPDIESLPGYWHSIPDYSPELGHGRILIYNTEKGHEHVAFTNNETNRVTVFNIKLYEKYLLMTDSITSEQKPETD